MCVNNQRKGAFEIKQKQYANKERVYVCVPLSVKNHEKMLETVCVANKYVRYVMKELQYFAIALHTYLPAFLNDKTFMQRDRLYDLRTQILKQCDILMICGERVSRDMKQEILFAIKERKQIMVFSSKVFNIVTKMIVDSGQTEFSLQYNESHPKLAKVPKICYIQRR